MAVAQQLRRCVRVETKLQLQFRKAFFGLLIAIDQTHLGYPAHGHCLIPMTAATNVAHIMTVDLNHAQCALFHQVGILGVAPSIVAARLRVEAIRRTGEDDCNVTLQVQIGKVVVLVFRCINAKACKRQWRGDGSVGVEEIGRWQIILAEFEIGGDAIALQRSGGAGQHHRGFNQWHRL